MTAIADALAAMAEGRRAPISPAKGHTGGTTPVEDVSVDDVVESLVDSSDDSQPKPHARRHRHRRRKSPSQGSDSERRATSAESQDMYPNESSPGANGEQSQPTSIRTVRPWSMAQKSAWAVAVTRHKANQSTTGKVDYERMFAICWPATER